MLYIGIVVGVIAIIWLKGGNNTKKETEETTEETGTMKKVTDIKIILFLIGIMILSEFGSEKMQMLGTVGDVVFIILIIYLGYLLFKKLFLR